MTSESPRQPASASRGHGHGGPSESSDAPTVTDLTPLRHRIDELDRRIVALLNERASVVVEVGKVKRARGVPVYAPHREADVLRRVLAASAGPLSARAIEAVYRELMSGSFALELPMRIGYLGPPGSFSHDAAVKHFGSSVELADLHEISSVFDAVRRGHVDHGLAPIENSTGGGVAETLDAFLEAREEVAVYAEVLLAVHHNLLAACPPGEVRRIHSKPEAFAQCRRWLGAQCPHAELVPAPSTSRAVQIARAEADADPGSRPAAIGSLLAGQLHGLNAVCERIEDNPNNITRFVVISRQRAAPSGDDKTSVMFRTADKPGALVRVLSEFDRAGVNLTHIDKRPSGADNWSYTFFIDAQGHRDDPTMADAIAAASTHCQQMIVLGSYPRAERIL